MAVISLWCNYFGMMEYKPGVTVDDNMTVRQLRNGLGATKITPIPGRNYRITDEMTMAQIRGGDLVVVYDPPLEHGKFADRLTVFLFAQQETPGSTDDTRVLKK